MNLFLGDYVRRTEQLNVFKEWFICSSSLAFASASVLLQRLCELLSPGA